MLLVAGIAGFVKWISTRPQACNFIKKETVTQMFSRIFCEIFKNTYFYRTPLVAASVVSPVNLNSLQVIICVNLITEKRF